MENIKIIVVQNSKITNSQREAIKQLQKKCFGHVSQKEIEEHFFSKGFAWVLAFHENEIVGILELHRRRRVFDKSKFLLGGVAGVCVCNSMRKRGIGSALVKRGLKTLKDVGCDVACMTVDLVDPMYGFYEKLGFKMMEREISFDDINGRRIYEKGTMFIPINSKKIYNQIMNSSKTFHYGKGYW
jgi:GNAT superfamily N-acetyltransferase